MQRVFSGIQPTGIPHLGNYLGALRNWAAMQADHDCVFCLVDMHSITMPWNPEDLRRQTLGSAACLLATGIEPTRLYNQSAVSAHARLGWIFNCVSRLGWLNRMTQFKDKAGKNRENHSAGLYVYPNLMAADILAFHATRVPVGDDQKQHIELANDIAQKFNHDMGTEFFPQIEAFIPPAAARVMSLRDGTKKMSKSDPSEQSRIVLTDTPDEIALKIRRAKTDSDALPSDVEGLEDRAEARNLVAIYAAMSDETMSDVLARFGGQGFGPFKNALADLLVEKLGPVATETARLMQNEDHIISVLRAGADRAREISEPIVQEAERLVGFIR
ncbi:MULTISPECIES: tryptophan--tRNA ligase [Gluconobacter]|uniref:Tryptophan--tRNA ligase n=1 Tax=Gluconobacter cerinus TaxID=38307 RepID=A0AAV5NHM0_9PROT|nr:MULTISPECIES: tryptophan--tRNA ligase [Gluconobacter]MBS0994831.1 tryptophan--tRNA ligase [Gluconobacter cerinus]MBS1019808.1 tryptophan--tRNA ligase [Gluconobacter cerinus]MBS1022882.1 tryptophan--tRNA ligase [Gluconobacter cerinus]MBS1024514.1 tryptophan--tRNA ligase [Gluconobacter cerinus]MBS1031534.1 tryptophan--tRNA ligase [Gluconobacter cerinus]